MADIRCPRQDENYRDKDMIFTDLWEDDTCKYCGSLSPNVLMYYLELKKVTLGPTDKNYKVYVEGIPNPHAGKPIIYSTANFEQTGEGWVKVTDENKDTLPLSRYHREYEIFKESCLWVKVEPGSEFLRRKFYFQHFSKEQRNRFIQLFNAQKLVLGYPGNFYVEPYFFAFKSISNEGEAT